MVNKVFELERLRNNLRNRGFEEHIVSEIVRKAEAEIEEALYQRMQQAVEQAVELGVAKESVDFINDIRPAPGAFALDTASGSLDFSEPPFPMLPHLLKNAKPMKDGSGVYKVIPVGQPGKKPAISPNIFDAQKAVMAERAEKAKEQYNRVAPSGSKAQFKTATSKQSAVSQWVLPAKDKDFTEEVNDINASLASAMENIILEIISEFEESF